MVSAKKADFEDWGRKFGISPVLARIIRNRDVTEEEQVRKFLYGTMADCHSPWLLHGMTAAVDLILESIARGTYVRVIGDYDVDGICSSYILSAGLRALGAKADTAIPHRVHDGYGLNEHLIENARTDGIGLIITCDNGIAAKEQIRLAKDYGMKVIVTDHHEVPFTEEEGEKREILPDADVIIDPRQQACSYPFPGICGAVVAFKLVQALQEKSGSEKLMQVLEELSEFAAIATVCDVMELKDENRILVKEGIRRLRRTGNPGLKALTEVNGLDPDGLSAYHMGFIIGPCLNATGRLDTALRALELLESRNKTEAMNAAAELKALNDSRKELTVKGVEQAVKYLEKSGKQFSKVIVVYLKGVHESLAGIIAGRIREIYHRPTFVLTDCEDGIKGSGRSIETYHMYENMTKVKDCFVKYGGHKLAAGLTLLRRFETGEEDVSYFADRINEMCTLTQEDFIPRVHIDVPMPLSFATEELARELELLEPFGVGNSKPLFAQKEVCFLKGRKMGAKLTCARYQVEGENGRILELLYFGDLERFHSFLDNRYGPGSSQKLYSAGGHFPVSVTYQLGMNRYHGKESMQFIMQNYC